MFLLLTLSAFAHSPSWPELTAAEGWSPVAQRSTDQGEVEVRLKHIGGLPCLQASATVDVKPDALLAVADDVPSATRWSSADLVLSDELARGEGYVEFVQLLDVPDWTLVTDRYWMLRGEAHREPDGTRRFRWSRVADGHYADRRATLAERGKLIEPPVNWGEWVFRPAEGGTRVVYSACADIGGAIPQGIQRWVATRTVPDNVADLVREARRR